MMLQIFHLKKMPQNCAECPFHDMTQHGEDGVAYPYCHALKQDRGYYFDPETKRFPNCPIEEEPEEKKEDPTETERLKNICRVMFNRCKVTGSLNGAMCVWCGLRKECKEMSGTSNKEGRMANV